MVRGFSMSFPLKSDYIIQENGRKSTINGGFSWIFHCHVLLEEGIYDYSSVDIDMSWRIKSPIYQENIRGFYGIFMDVHFNCYV